MSKLANILVLLDRSLLEAIPADEGWLLVEEARDRLRELEMSTEAQARRAAASE